MGFGASAPLAPKLGEAHGGSQLQRLRSHACCRAQRFLEASVGFIGFTLPRQQNAPEPFEVRREVTLLRYGDNLQRLVECH